MKRPDKFIVIRGGNTKGDQQMEALLEHSYEEVPTKGRAIKIHESNDEIFQLVELNSRVMKRNSISQAEVNTLVDEICGRNAKKSSR